eukprot:11661085-Alexandrium_andersonii.AAC.1
MINLLYLLCFRAGRLEAQHAMLLVLNVPSACSPARFVAAIGAGAQHHIGSTARDAPVWKVPSARSTERFVTAVG